MSFTLYNTLSRSKETFTPWKEGHCSVYACGPTVYHFAHIGNLRTYVSVDVLVRTLRYQGLKVEHMMNITDVGHLESDGDEGEDKMSLAMKREDKDPWAIARFYEEHFMKDIDALNIVKPNIITRATEHIEPMIQMIEQIIAAGAGYVVEGNVYFDITQYEDYARLSGRDLASLKEGARVEVDPHKKNPLDFVLWFSRSKYPNQIMQWDSPWGRGFPGWHIECSAMSMHYLGDEIDIHCGGVDHVSVHHTNEIAQSETCTQKRWVNYWFHGEFLINQDGKMSKSTGQFLRLSDLIDKGYQPVHFRYLCLSSHYRSQLMFSLEAMDHAKRSFEALKNRAIAWRLDPSGQGSEDVSGYQKRFDDALMDDLNMPIVLSIVWEMAKDKHLSAQAKLKGLESFDQVLGLGVHDFQKPEISDEMKALIEERLEARARKDWARSDALRETLRSHGIEIKDTPEGCEWYHRYKD